MVLTENKGRQKGQGESQNTPLSKKYRFKFLSDIEASKQDRKDDLTKHKG